MSAMCLSTDSYWLLPFQSRSCPKDKSTQTSEGKCQLQAKLRASSLRPLLWMMTCRSAVTG